MMSQWQKGNQVDLIGPLGRGFGIPSKDTSVFIVAGGMGLAPMISLFDHIYLPKTKIFFGAKTTEEVLALSKFIPKGTDNIIVSEDGKMGPPAPVTEAFKQYVLSLNTTLEDYKCFACGPFAMLKEIGIFANKMSLFCEISLEEKMACGVGACLGCVVKGTSGYIRTCKEGPVFNCREIMWD